MPNYPESGIKLVADTADYTTAMNDAIFLADYFDSLGTIAIDVVADVDTSALDGTDLPTDGDQIDITIEADVQGDLADLPLDGETVNYTVEADVEGDLADLPLDGETVNFTAEGTVEGTAADLPKDGETITTTVDVKETETAAKTLTAVETLKNLKVMETIWNIGGTAINILGQVQEFAVKPMLSLDEAIAKVDAQTGGAIPNAERLIKDIFYDDLGTSIDQVGKMAVKAAQLKAPIDEAVRAALTFTHTFTDENPETVLDTLNQMVITKLAPNFTVAGDMMVRAFQNGANRGGDLLKAIGDNAGAIHDLGLDGPQSLAFIKTGLDAGFKSAQAVIDVLVKIKQNVANAAGNADSDVSKTLKTLGIANPAETGEAWSAEFFESVIDKIKTMPGLTDTEREQLFSNLAGGKQGAKVFSSFMEISAEDADGIFKNVAGAADKAASAMDDSLSGAIDDFMLAAQKAATEFLSSEQIDLPGKISALKTGLQDALNVLGQSGSLGEALTVALKPIGFDDEFMGLESALSNFVIGILQAVAQLQDLTGHGAEAAGTRNTITQMGAKQLAFDLKIANTDDIAATIETAVSRGVTPDGIVSNVKTAVDELIASGATDRAQALIDTLQTQADTGIQLQLLPGIDESTKGLVKQQLEAFGFGTLNPDGTISMKISPGMSAESIAGLARTIQDTVTGNFDAKVIEGVEIKPTLSQDAVDGLQADVDAAIGEAKSATDLAMRDTKDASLTLTNTVNTATTNMETQATAAVTPVNDLATKTTSVGQAAATATPSIDQQTTATTKVGNESKAAAPKVDRLAQSVGAVVANADTASASMEGLAAGITLVINAASALQAAASHVADVQGTLNNTPTTGTGGASIPENATGTQSAIGTFMTGEQGRELVTSNRQLAVLNNMTTEAIMSALNGYIPSGSSSQSSGRGVVVNNTNIVQSEAQADAVGYGTAQILRGMN